MPIVLMLLTTLVTLYLRTERKIALLALTVAALLGCGWHGWSLWAIIPSALLLGLAAALLFPNPVRTRISAKVLDLIRNLLPSLSETEQQALRSGDVDWDAQLFSGKPDWDTLLNAPPFRLSDEEQQFVDGPVSELCAKLDDWKITQELMDLPEAAWRYIRESGFFGLVIDKQYGGKGFSAAAHSEIVMKISTRSVSAAVTVMVPNSLGPAELLQHYGTDEQKQHYLPRLAAGKEIPCFALTSALAGSDAGAIPDLGIVTKGQWKGKETLGLSVTWNKRYITLAPVATLIGLAIKVEDPNGLLGADHPMGVTCVLIPSDTDGVHQGDRHLPMNQAFMNGPTWGEDVFIPMEQIIGGQERIGQGWIMLLECLSVGRAISLPALSTGAGKHCCLTTGAYAAIRQQFGRSIAEFEGVQEALEPIAGDTYMMDAARRLTAAMLDRGIKPAIPSALLKYRNTELMRDVVNNAMDVVAGRGVIVGPRNFLARVYQSLPISITVEGANILTRSLMVFGQGAIRCHPYLVQEIEAASANPSADAVKQFEQAFFGHLGHAFSNVLRSLGLALSLGYLSRTPNQGQLQPYYRRLNRFSAALALLTDVSLAVIGGKLKARERLSGRMADSLVSLYYASATLKYFHDNGYPEEERVLVDWAMKRCLYDVQRAMNDVIANYPVPWLRPLLRVLVFPLGLRLAPPGDLLGQQVSQTITQPGVVRDTLTRGIYLNLDPEDAVGRVLNAFKLQTETAHLQEKLHRAVRESDQTETIKGLEMLLEKQRDKKLQWAEENGVLSQDETRQLSAAMSAIYDALRVDSFAGKAATATKKAQTKALQNAS
ncbi:MAG TPA: acyl-CoA dehydrogenase [Gammaproteobacteria bacterium]|nr:acyl-CoA dehydrogenase [Gammaproteobacteria bacterium]